MREDMENPSVIYSYQTQVWDEHDGSERLSSDRWNFHENEGLKNNPVELNKKRKLQEGESDLPIPKHKCWDRSFVSEPIFVLEKEPEVESTFKNIITGKTEAASMSCESEPESGRDSNSFGGDSDSATSTHGEAKIQVEYVKTNFDRPSTSSVNCDSNSFKHANYSSGFRKGKLAFLSGEHPKHHDGLQAFENLEEHLVDLCDQVDYTSSGDMETTALNCLQIEELDVEDILYSNGVNPANMYVLSSGRWTVSQDAQPGTRKPTIDQEFEQFFSKLML